MITNATLNKMDQLHALKKKIKSLKAKKQALKDKRDEVIADLDAKQIEFDNLEAEIIAEIKALT